MRLSKKEVITLSKHQKELLYRFLRQGPKKVAGTWGSYLISAIEQRVMMHTTRRTSVDAHLIQIKIWKKQVTQQSEEICEDNEDG